MENLRAEIDFRIGNMGRYQIPMTILRPKVENFDPI